MRGKIIRECVNAVQAQYIHLTADTLDNGALIALYKALDDSIPLGVATRPEVPEIQPPTEEEWAQIKMSARSVPKA